MKNSRTTLISEQFNARIIMMKVAHLTYPEHLHQQYELLLVLEGSVEVIAENNVWRANAGDLVFIGSETIHAYYSSSASKMLMYAIYPQQAPQFAEQLAGAQALSCFVPSVIDDSTVRTLIQDWSAHSPEDGLSLALQTNLLLSRVMDALSRQPRPAPIRSFPQPLREALSFISNRLPENITMDMLAEHAGVSLYHLSHLFGQTLGLSFSDYNAILRINAARRMLVQTDRSVTEIAQRCGYANNRTFNRNFIRVAGVTPSEYRDSHAGDPYVDYDTPFVRSILRSHYADVLDSAPEA